jgi:hypothetical protein
LSCAIEKARKVKFTIQGSGCVGNAEVDSGLSLKGLPCKDLKLFSTVYPYMLTCSGKSFTVSTKKVILATALLTPVSLSPFS